MTDRLKKSSTVIVLIVLYSATAYSSTALRGTKVPTSLHEDVISGASFSESENRNFFTNKHTFSRRLNGFGWLGRIIRGKKEPSPCLPSQPQKFDYCISSLMANFSSIAYCNDHSALSNWKCTHCRNVPGFIITRYINNIKLEAYGFVGYYPPLDAKIVAIKGSNSRSVKNWIINSQFGKRMIPLNMTFRGYSNFQVHDGFGKAWQSALRDEMLDAVHELIEKYGKEGPLYVTGHSSGGAMAHLAALTFKISLKLPDVRLYTFGSPRVGNEDFAHIIPRLMTETWRFTHSKDFVPALPFESFGYRHSPYEIFQEDRKGQKKDSNVVYRDETFTYKKCDASGEDPDCYKHLCSAGFVCRSIEDHYHYLHTFMGDDSTC